MKSLFFKEKETHNVNPFITVPLVVFLLLENDN